MEPSRAPSQQEGEQQPSQISLAVAVLAPVGNEHGTYANIVSVRSTDTDFILDFAHVVPLNDIAGEETARERRIEVPARVRVILPVPVVPRLMHALQGAFEAYMRERGLPTRPSAGGDEE